VSSTSVRTLRRFGATAPELLRAISYPRDRLGVGQVAWPGRVTAGGAASLRAAMPVGVRLLLGSSRASAVSLHKSLVSPAVVRAARGRGAIVLAWTANDAAQIERLAIAGVDAIVSDDPARALEVLATLNPL
jgi:glycerophosphoryl diester phosphodiesterase